MPKMKVVLMGPPGSGKGTQAVRIADKLGVDRVSSGDLFREHRRNDTELGRLVRSYMDQGAYVPDDVTIKMMAEWIATPNRAEGFLLDGFPRTLAQAKALDQVVDGKVGVDKALYIDVPEDELNRRLTSRVICQGCQTPYHLESSPPKVHGECDNCGGNLYQREDDQPEVVKKRIQVYHAETEPVVEYFRKSDRLKEIDGNRSIEDVGSDLVAAVCE